MPEGTTKYAPVTAYKQVAESEVSITRPQSFPGSYIIVVTAVNGTSNTITWDGSNDAGVELSSGIYIIHLQVDDKIQTRRLMLVR